MKRLSATFSECYLCVSVYCVVICSPNVFDTRLATGNCSTSFVCATRSLSRGGQGSVVLSAYLFRVDANVNCVFVAVDEADSSCYFIVFTDSLLVNGYCPALFVCIAFHGQVFSA